MRLHYLKKGNLYLHIQTDLFEQYEDYSDISGMFNQQYIFSEKKEGAMEFQTKVAAERYLFLNKRKLKGFIVVRE
ncbi:hypothetical protein NQU59_16070 [Acinetobacter colistiniresistens]|uniref:hypothetical protein n=1 Tax=Acinetobacter colistiniresistens TaxID=280145 RepID=UPI00211C409C|nr:hypothetical protein [Acinetobacter colistiniresistens]UUM27158.1 hypothetical protein NQU59_16070 [Acinetobacter colistiniresistens]